MMRIKAAIFAAAAAWALAAQAQAGVVAAEQGESKLKLGAKFYIDASTTKKTQNGQTIDKTTGAGLGRAYFSVSYQFDDVWSMGLTTDAGVEPTLKKRTSVYIKKAYLRGAFSPAFTFEMGVIGTPWIGHEEHLMKHRYATKTFVDTYKFDSSADAGIGFKGKLGDVADYHFTIVNGAGYGNITKTNATDFNGRIGFSDLGATLDLQYRSGYMGTKTFTNGVNNAGTKYTLTQAMASYGVDEGFAWRVGANYISAKRTNAGTSIKSTGLVGWFWTKTPDGFGLWGRFEQLKQKGFTGGVTPKTTRTVIGLEWFPRKHVAFSLVYDASKTTDAQATLTAKTKTADVAKGKSAKATTYGLFAEVKF